MKRFWKKSISVLMTIVMFVGLAADLRFGAVEVLAAETTSGITVSNVGLKINDMDYVEGMFVPKNSKFVLDIEWGASNNVSLGNDLSIKLPAGLNWSVSGGVDNKGTLTNNGQNIGNYELTDGVIHMHINDITSLGNNIGGSFRLYGTLDGTADDTDDQGRTKIELFDKTIIINVTDSSDVHQLNIQKWPEGSYDYDNGITFKVQVNSYGTNKHVQINDIFDTSKIDMIDVENFTVTSSKNGSVRGTLEQTSEGFTYSFPDDYVMQNNETCILSYTLKFKDSAYAADYVTGYNKAAVKSDTADANTGNIEFRADKTWIDKKGTYNNDGTVTWKIVINQGMPTDIAGTKFTDQLPSEFTLASDITISGTDGFSAVVSKDDAASGIVYTFPKDKEYTGTYTITYTTTVTTNENYNTITGGWTSSNKARIDTPKYGSHSDSETVYIPGIGNVLDKKYTSVEEDFENKLVRVHWVSTVSVPTGSTIDFSNFTYTDNVDMGNWEGDNHRLVTGSVVVKQNNVVISEFSGNSSAVQYQCNDNQQNFMIAFGDYFKDKAGNGDITIEYDTSFELPAENQSLWGIKNTGIVDFNGVKQSDTEQVSYKHVPAVSKTYNGAEKDNTEFTWVVRINLDNNKLQNNEIIYLEEKLPENQKLVDGSLKAVLETWSYDWNSSDDGITLIGQPDGILKYSINTGEVKKSQNSNQIIILMYKTKIDNYKEFIKAGKKNYTNTVTVKDSNDKPAGVASATASNIMPVPGKTLSKNFEYTASTAPYVNYYIDVNTDRKTLLDGTSSLTLTDVIGSAMQYVPGSFNVYSDAARRIPLTEPWTMNYDPATNTITVTLPDEKACYISYRTIVTLKEGERLNKENASNTVSLSGELEDSLSDTKFLSGSVIQSSGLVYSEMGTFKLYKHKKDDINSPIPNAEYTATICYTWNNGNPQIVDDEHPLSSSSQDFKNYDPNKRYVTGDDGIVFINNIYFDMLYKIEEVSAPNGYKLNPEPVYYYIVGNDNSNFADALKAEGINAIPVSVGEYIFVDDEEADKVLPKIKIFKSDKSAPDIAAEGARLSLTCKDKNNNEKIVATWTSGNEAKEFTVDTNGTSTDSDVLKCGDDYTYILHEVAPPKGFAAAADITFKISASGKITDESGGILSSEDAMLTMQDNRAVYIQKIASDTGALLGGAELQLVKSGGSFNTSWNTSDANPKVVELENGTYTLTETNSPVGYKKADPITFTVTNGRINKQDGVDDAGITLTMIDQAVGNLTITKVDFADGKKPLSGAIFTLTDAKGNNYTAKVADNTTDSDGKLVFENLPYGTYTLTETKAPENYEINQKVYTIEINASSVEKVITNTKKTKETGTVTIIKRDKDDGSKKLAGAEFTLTNDAGTDEYSAVGTTNQEGKVIFNNVPYGDYLLEETKAPFGYEKTLEKVTVTSENGSTEIDAVDGKYSITLGDGKKSIELTVADKQLGSLKISKQDDNNHAIEGVKFELTKDGVTYHSKNTDDRTGADGTIVFNNLPFGTYTLKETDAPVGYDITVAEQTVTINSADETSLTVTNNRKYIYIGKTAVDDNQQLGGAEFEICDSSGHSLSPAITFTSTDTELHKIFLGQNAGELKPGDYQLKEIKAPDNYKIGEPVKFTINENGTISITSPASNADVSSDGLTLTMKDELNIGKITLTKLDAFADNTGKHVALQGAKFKLFESDGTTPAKDKDGNELTEKTTGTDGKLSFENLLYGTYILVETEAPTVDGTRYDIISEKTTIVLDGTNKNVTLYNQEHKDKITKIEFQKVDAENTSKGLEGAEFELYQGEEYIAGSSSEEDGTVTFDNIPYSDSENTEYRIKEIKPPKNYEVSASETKIIVGTDGKAYIDIGENKELDKIPNQLIRVNITVHKEDENNNPLAGAKFKLYYADGTTPVKDKDGNELVEETTDDDGNLTFKDIPYGEYVLMETKAPAHYSIIGNGKTRLYLNEDTVDKSTQENGTTAYTYEKTITNQQKTVSISKKVLGTNNNLSGATLKLTADTSPIQVKLFTTTDSAEIFKIGDTTDLANGVLAPGVIYTLTEEDPVPQGYLKAPEIKFQIAADDSIQVTNGTEHYYVVDSHTHLIMYDEPYGNIKIVKVNANNHEAKLNGAIFKLYKYSADGKTLVEVKDENGTGSSEKKTGNGGEAGTATFTKLPYGTYLIKETKAPSGFLPISEEIHVTVNADTVDADNCTVCTVSNTPQTLVGDIVITKTVDEITDPLAGVEFGLYKDTNFATPVLTKSTEIVDGIAKAEFKNIPFGTYYIREISAPFGYSSDPVSVKVNINGKDKDATLYQPENNKTLKFYEVVVGDGGTPTDDKITINVSVTDKKLKGTLKIYKIREGTKEPINDVTFKLYDKDGTIYNIVTDKTGVAIKEDLEFGEYVLVEDWTDDNYIKPTGDAAEHTVMIKNEGITEITITNEPKKGKFKIKKIDEDDPKSDEIADAEGLFGAVYEIYNIKKLVLEEDKRTENDLGNKVASGRTNSNGEYEFTDIPYGDYYLVEVEAPLNYAVDKKIKKITVDSESSGIDFLGNPTELQLKAVSDEKLTGEFTVLKTDLDNSPLPGAEFVLKNADGYVVTDNKGNVIGMDAPEEDKEKAVRTRSTNDEGKITYIGLPYGSYTLIETTAPEYHTIVTKEYDIYFDEDLDGKLHEEKPYVVTNENIKFEISKRIKGGTSELIDEKLKLQILDETGKTVKLDSDSLTMDGTARVIGLGKEAGQLEPGTYILREVNPPENYATAKDLKFKVNENGEVEEVAFGIGKDGTKDGEILKDNLGNYTLVMYDELAVSVPPKDIKISKRSVNQTGELKGAELVIYNANKKEVMDSWTTGETEHVITVGAKVEKDKGIYLMYNELYILQERKAPDDTYAIADEIYFRVEFDGKIKFEEPDNVTSGILSEENTHLTLVDDRKITISKKDVDNPDKELANVYFKLYKGDSSSEDNFVCDWWTTETPHEISVGVGKDSIEFDTIYQLEEQSAPKGYLLAKPIQFQVHKEDGKIVLVTENNKAHVSDTGTELTVWNEQTRTIAISKKAVGGTNELANANFTIFISNPDGTVGKPVIENLISGTEANRLTVGEAGQNYQLEFNQVYTLREMAPPEGYLTTNDIRFAVEPDGKIMVVDENNMPVLNSDALSSDRKTLTMYDPLIPTADAFTSEDGTPKTGDNTPIALLIILIIIAAAVIAGLVITNKRSLSEKNLEEQTNDDQTDEENKESNN